EIAGRTSQVQTVDVTAASYTVAFAAAINQILHPTVTGSVVVTTDAGTTGRVRVRETTTGAVTADRALPAGAATTATIAWAHGIAPGSGPLVFVVEAVRDTGTGNVTVSVPTQLAANNTAGVSGGIS
ncbi:MAG: hypothetical protein ACYDAD_15105, partial [Acidimicrobiales bacterium]